MPPLPPLSALIALATQGALLLLLIGAALSDLRRRRIPNRLCLAIACLALPYWLATDASGLRALVQILSALGLVALLLSAFNHELLGGGDVKLMAALALWLPPLLLGRTMLLTAILGGLLGLAVLLHGRRRMARRTVPYGVAIALAGVSAILPRIIALIPASAG